MKKSFLVIFIVTTLISAVAAQPLTGIKTIPGDYSTIKFAIDALNLNGVGTGGVTFNIAPNFKEVFTNPDAGYITTATASATNPVIFQKGGAGANPLITAAIGTGSMDAIFLVSGTDYVTFDGIDVRTNPDSFGNEDQMEWGFAILKTSGTNGSQYITIKNCSITLDKSDTLSTGIYSNNHTIGSTTQLMVTSANGTNSNLKFFNNQITNSYCGICIRGFAASSSPYNFYDQNNEIGKDGANVITNFGGYDAIAYGIYTIYQNGLKVANNTITSACDGSKSVYGIIMTTSKSSSYELYGNTVSIQFASSDGYNANLTGIWCDMGEGGTNNTANVYNNTVTNCTYPTMISGAYFRGIYLNKMGITSNVYGNTVSNNTIGSTNVSAKGEIRYFWCQQVALSPGSFTVHDNMVSGNARYTNGAQDAVTKMLTITGSGTTLEAYNNNVSSNIVTTSGATHCLDIGFKDNSGKFIHNNTVTDITEANGAVVGLYNTEGFLGYIYNNKIQGIHASTTSTYANITGINHSSGSLGAGTMYYYNNMVADLTNPGANAIPGYSYNALNGIYVEGSVGSFKGFYNNTVYLNGTATNSNEYGSSAFCTQRLSEVDLRNNIFINTSESAGPNGKTVGIRSRDAGFANFTSNYNDIYAGAPGPANLIFYDGSTGAQTLVQYQSIVAPQEAQSVSAMPPFVNITVVPYDIHLKPNVPTQCESGGVAVAMPVTITTDFDGEARYPEPGFPVNGSYVPSAPDLGADEFGGIPLNTTSPNILYTPLQSTNNGNARTLTATITDGSGVPTSGFGLPVLYWKKNSLAYVAVQGVYTGPDSYTFTFGAGAVLNDVISYYIVAQDNNLPIPNVGAFPYVGASGFSSNPPDCTTPPSNPSSYQIIPEISGIKHVGIGKDYTTLTAAATDLNGKFMAGPVTLVLDDNSYPSESFPIRFNTVAGNSQVNTLTIKPNTGATPVLIGPGFQNGMIVMNGIDYATIDGSNNGTNSKNLTIENTSCTMFACAVSITNNGGIDPSTNITIKNCILKGSISNPIMDNHYVIMFNANGGPGGGGYDNCVISNNSILKSLFGIGVEAATGNRNRGIIISGNQVSSADTADYITRGGILLSNSENTIISDNEVLRGTIGTGYLFEFGIIVYNYCPNTKIIRNKIHDWNTVSWGSYGIKYSNESANPPSEISNNLIYDITCYGANPGVGNNLAYGIFIRRGSNVKIWHNSIYLRGPYLAGSDNYAPSSACIGVYEAASYGLDIRNNILRNSMTNPINPPPGSGAEGRAYGIMFAGNESTFGTLDYNDYHIDGYMGSVAMRWITGWGFGDFYNTLADWQAYTGKELHSVYMNPEFVSDTTPINLHPTNLNINSIGGPKILDTDYDGAIRYTPPDMGAYEWSALITGYHTLAATSVTETGAMLHGDIDTKGEVVEISFDYGTTTNYGSVATPTPNSVRSVGTLLPDSAALTGLLPNTTYHFRFKGIPMTSGQAILYGMDMTFTTGSSVPVNITVTNTVTGTQCFNASQTITVAGTPNTFIVAPTGQVDLIAGVNILMLPGTKVENGGYLHAKISNQYCGQGDAPVMMGQSETEFGVPLKAQTSFRVYPNPTNGEFILESNTFSGSGYVNIEIYDLRGMMILKTSGMSPVKHELSLAGKPAGIYLVRVSSDTASETLRVIKN